MGSGKAEWAWPLTDGGGDRCGVRWNNSAMGRVLGNSRIGCPDGKHVHGRDHFLVLLVAVRVKIEFISHRSLMALKDFRESSDL